MNTTKKRCLRTRRSSSSSDSDGEGAEVLEKQSAVGENNVVEVIRELQRVRKRPAGIDLAALCYGKAAPEVAIVGDPFKLKTGGLVCMKEITRNRKGEEEDDVEVRLTKTFATETNKRDEDAEMIKYIEEELAKRKGLRKTPSPEPREGSDLLRDVPEYLRPAIGQQREDMMSNQMLCGIPEVDLGVEAKMKNIEATEEAKQSLLRHRFNRRYGPNADGMAPTNVAVNFVQHSRWNNHSSAVTLSESDYRRELMSISARSGASKLTQDPVEPPHIGVEVERLRAERATDSLALQRFKTHMRGRRRR
ncbi:Hepatocellular carcinoma associated antigen 59 [Fasciola hepatica]|uniref:Hepatocellular carcinoma associated antigen 59 n=1 Tax=Fasciola hepatica TaxID=6192 RepID=A0A4E0R215_FASHE|nr:Hepatocellular carcinoma associated antigen 59 [Fasciola hepatica]